jgi:glucose-1-phosphate adenylyltransferase
MGDWMQRIRDVSVVILGGGRGTRLDPLTRMRAKPAVPMAGKYRLIDIPISNCLHSQMDRMLLLTQFNSISLHRHIAWTYKFDPFSPGFVQILAAQQTPEGERWFQGTADAVRQNLHIIRELRGDMVLILSGDHMYRADYREMLFDHLEHEADVTIAVLPCSEREISGFGAVRTDESGSIVEFREKPATAESRQGMAISSQLQSNRELDPDRPYLASMGVYLFRKEALVEALKGDEIDFGNDIIPRMTSTHRIQAHFFKGYWRDIGTIRSFYDAHMDLLTVDPRFNFNDSRWPIYTRPRWLPGARLDKCSFIRSVTSDGTRISDSLIEDSIIGINTVIRNATVRRSLIMGVDGPGPEEPHAAPAGAPPIGIGHGTLIEGAIVDKNTRIGANVRVVNERGVNEDEGEGWAIRDGIVVISKNAIIPDGTVI